jgi:Ca-activated chloride channel family protein
MFLRAALPWAARAACLIALLAAVPAGAQPPVFRAGVDLINIGVTVVDRAGNLVTDLTADDFEIREDGEPQTIRHFAAGDSPMFGAPLHVGLLLDVSGSMVQDIEFTRTASIRFLKTLPSAASITVVDFDTEVRVTRFSTRDFPRLVERIRNQRVQGRTALYDAIGVYLDGAAEQNGRKIMLLYTDGGDTRSSLGLNGLLNLLKASDVTVYIIGAIDRQPQAAKVALRSVLQQIAETSGGQAFFPGNTRELDRVYTRVLAEIRAQYTLGYLSTNTRTDGAWRGVEVTIRRADARNLRIRARDGYYGLYRP